MADRYLDLSHFKQVIKATNTDSTISYDSNEKKMDLNIQQVFEHGLSRVFRPYMYWYKVSYNSYCHIRLVLHCDVNLHVDILLLPQTYQGRAVSMTGQGHGKLKKTLHMWSVRFID